MSKKKPRKRKIRATAPQRQRRPKTPTTFANPKRCRTCITCDNIEVIKGAHHRKIVCTLGICPNITIKRTKKAPGFLAPKGCIAWVEAKGSLEAVHDLRTGAEDG